MTGKELKVIKTYDPQLSEFTSLQRSGSMDEVHEAHALKKELGVKKKKKLKH
jgi:hypothetical protein